MTGTKRTATLILALVMVLSLVSACGKTPFGGSAPGKDGGGKTGQELLAESEYTYTSEYIKIAGAENVSGIGGASYYEGRIYFPAQVAGGKTTHSHETGEIDAEGNPITEEYESETYVTKLFSVREDGTDFRPLEAYAPIQAETPDGRTQEGYVERMTMGADGTIFLVEHVCSYEAQGGTVEASATTEGDAMVTPSPHGAAPEGGGLVPTDTYYVRKLDLTGAELIRTDLASLSGGGENSYFYVTDMKVAANGKILLADESNIYFFESDLLLSAQLHNDDENRYFSGFKTMSDGSTAALYQGQTNTIVVIDTEKAAFGKEYAFPTSPWETFSGNSEYDFFYNTGTVLMGYKAAANSSEAVLSWINSDVDSNFSFVLPMDDGRIICCSSGCGSTGEEEDFSLIVLKRVLKSSLPERTILSYATVVTDYSINAEILNFNRESTSHRIEVLDYSEFNTQNDRNAGYTRLMTDITSGKIPDILNINFLPIETLAKKGLIEDLMPLLEADTKIGGSAALLPAALSAMQSHDGKLYSLRFSFSIWTAYGISDIVGEKSGMSFEEAKALLAQLPKGARLFDRAMTKTEYFRMLCNIGLSGLVNLQTGECRFDSPEFMKMLEFSSFFPESVDRGGYGFSKEDDPLIMLTEKKQLLTMAYISSDFYDFRRAYEFLDGKLSFTGFPGGVGNGSAMYFNSGLAITTTCRDKAGAWNFIGRFLSPKLQEQNQYGALPVSLAAFESLMKKHMTPEYREDPNAEGGKVEVPKTIASIGRQNPVQIPLYAMSQAEYDIIMELINGTTSTHMFDQQLTAIIMEEVGAYFAGTRSAEDTAKMIQNRVAIYVSEQS